MRIPRIAALVFLPVSLFALACQSNRASTPTPPGSAAAPTAATSPSAHAQISEEFTAAAQIASIAPAERVLTLRREDGSLFEVQAGEAVRNFDQIKVGDEVRVHYKAVLAVAKLPPGESARPMQGAFAAARAKPGAKPAAGVGAGVSLSVHIESLDREHGIVVFALASGELIAHRVQTKEGADFVRQLAVGDVVQIDYGAAVALGVDKP